ncbi:Uncharacterised protein [Mycobacterium tuberculosis]|uniref:Uncharacterized protein n=1 Tax=Mycobacterium tuberculosis TaxID=1773 RepID=A0A916LFF3_MYCTX|nr:Uncharacterised protein [Mycobacterium tuberculosis]
MVSPFTETTWRSTSMRTGPDSSTPSLISESSSPPRRSTARMRAINSRAE